MVSQRAATLFCYTVSTLLLACGQASAQFTLQNSSFEALPFDSGWSNTAGAIATPVAGIAPGSTTAAQVQGNNSQTRLNQGSLDPTQWRDDFNYDFYFQVLGGLGSGRSLHFMVEQAGDVPGNGLSEAVAGRINNLGELQFFSGHANAWQTVPGATGFAANQTYRIKLYGRNWGDQDSGASLAVAWSNAGSADLTNFSSLTTLRSNGFRLNPEGVVPGFEQQGLPARMSGVEFLSQFQSAGDPSYIIDDVTLTGATSATWTGGAGSFSTGSEWAGGAVPEIASNITITNGGAINQDSNGVVGDLIFNSAAATTISGNGLSVQGDIVASQGSHTISSDVFSRGGVFSAAAGANLDLIGVLSSSDDFLPTSFPPYTARTFYLDGAGTGSLGAIRDDIDPSTAPNNDNIAIVKRGSGAWTIGTGTGSGTENNFHGETTTIEEGALIVKSNGSNDGELRSPLINVQEGGTFDTTQFATYSMQPGQTVSGSGQVASNTFAYFNDGSITPGDSTGTLDIAGNLSMATFGAATGALNYELSNVATVGNQVNDLIDVSGALTLSANAGETFQVDITPVNGTLAGNATYRLIDAASSTVDPNVAFNVSLVNAAGAAITNTRFTSLSVSTATNGQVNLQVTGSSADLTWTGAGSSTWDVNTTQNWNGGGAETFFNLDAVNFVNNGAPSTVEVPAAVNSGGTTVSGSYTFTGAGGIAGTGGLTVVGGSQDGDYNNDGGVDAADYTVFRDKLGTTSGLPNNAGLGNTVDQSYYDLWKANFGQSGAGPTVTLATANNSFTGAINIGNSATLQLGNGVANLNTLDQSNAIVNNDTLYLNDGDGEQLDGDITGSGAIIVNAFANGALTLTGDNSFTGPVIVNSGSLRFVGGDAIGAPASATVNAGGTLRFDRVSATVAAPITLNGGILSAGNNQLSRLTVAGPVALGAAGNSTIALDAGTDGGVGRGMTVAGDITGSSGGNLVLQVGASSTMTLAGAASHNGGLTKTSAGRAELQAANTYAGNTLVNSGTLALLGGGSIASSPEISVAKGATFDVSGAAGGNYSLASGQLLTGLGSVKGDLTAASGSTVRVGTAGIAFTPNVTSAEDFESEVAPAVVFSGNTQTGLPAWTLIDARPLSPVVPPNTAGANDVAFSITNNAISGSKALDQTNNNHDFPSAGNAHNGSMALSTLDTSGALDRVTATIGQNDPSGGFADVSIVFGYVDQRNYMYAQVQQDGLLQIRQVNNDTIGANLATLAASPANTFPNNTAWTAELIQDTRSGAVTFTVTGGATTRTLSVTNDRAKTDGRIGFGSHNDAWFVDNVSITTGTPADTINLLTVNGDYAQAAGSELQIDIVSTIGYDRFVVDGALTAGGVLDVDVPPSFSPAAGDFFDILDFVSLSGAFTYDLPTLSGGLLWDTSQVASTGVLSIVSSGALAGHTSVPEPGSVVLVIVAAAGLACRGRVSRRV